MGRAKRSKYLADAIDISRVVTLAERRKLIDRLTFLRALDCLQRLLDAAEKYDEIRERTPPSRRR